MATYNVRDYGATGNGVANDRAAIQAALDAAYAAGGGTVYIPAGTYAIDGGSASRTYAGLQVRDNVTIVGDGMGQTVIKAMAGNSVGFTGLIRTPVGVATGNVTISDLTLDGNKALTSGKTDGFFCGTDPGSTLQDFDITVLRVEVRDCDGYGFDPHEQTVRLRIEDSVAHGNYDGFTLDFQIDALIRNNLSYDNERHGFNIVTQTHDIVLDGNQAYDNGSAGIAVQRGSENVPAPYNIVIRGGQVHGNVEGVQIKMADHVTLDGVHVYENDREGVKVYGAPFVTIRNSTIENNSQSGTNGYAEIFFNTYVDTLTGANWIPTGAVVTGNVIGSTGAVHSSYGIREAAAANDSLIDGNSFVGTFARATTFTGPQVRSEMPDLRAPSEAFSYTIAPGAYVDVDPLDAVTLSLQRVDAAGQLLGGGALPSWLSFDAVLRKLTGAPVDEHEIWLRVVAKDKSGDAEYDVFKLTVTDAGGWNVATAATPPPPPNPGVYDVRDFGAVGDGVANDRDAIQRAIDAAFSHGGGVVVLPAGVFGLRTVGRGDEEAGLQLRSGVTLRGAGMDLTVIRVLAGESGDIEGVVRTVYSEASQDTALEDLTIDGNRSSTTGLVDGLMIGGDSSHAHTDVSVARVQVVNASGYGVEVRSGTTDVSLVGVSAHHNGLDGFLFSNAHDVELTNGAAWANGRHGVSVTDGQGLRIDGGTIHDNAGEGIAVQNIEPGGAGVAIVGTQVFANGQSGILVKASTGVTVDDVEVHDNARDGVKFEASGGVGLQNSTIEDNSQAGNDLYSEVAITGVWTYIDTGVFLTGGVSVVDNTIASTGPVRASWGLRESAEVTGSYIEGNTIGAGVDGVSRTGPQIRSAMPDLISDSGGAFQYVLAPGAYRDADPGDVLSYSLWRLATATTPEGPAPVWLTIDPLTGTLQGNAPPGAGIFELELRVSDASGDVTRDSFRLTVGGSANSAPYVAAPLPDQQAAATEAFQFQFAANAFADPDAGDVLTYTASLATGAGLPAWLSFDSATRSFSGVPAAGDQTVLQIKVTANDGAGHTVSDVFQLTVSPPANRWPVLAQPLADQQATATQAFQFQFAAAAFTDPDAGDVLTYAADRESGAAL
ncbi:MAG TPA: putative Ig domain-containing protein, partial [Phenylobacterium sp.]